MGSRREEERNEKIIRGLMKLPPNRRCINCNSLGPQYVCTNFWTFVCITCSGIHREFTHRVKSVSMAKFTSQEVEALQNGGNQRARELYLKTWDLQRQRLPDSSNADKVREFIRSVYVEKKYAGGTTSDKPPRDSQTHRSSEDVTRRASSYHSYSQSPPYDYQYEERRYGKQASGFTSKSGSERGFYGKASSFVYSPGHINHHSVDRFENEGSGSRASDFSISSVGDPVMSASWSADFQKENGFSSPSFQRSRVASSENLQHQTTNLFADVPPQRTTSFMSVGSFDSNSESIKPYNSGNFVDTVSESELTTATHQDKTSAPIPSSAYGGLELFNALPASDASASKSSSIDLFQLPEAPAALSADTIQPSTVTQTCPSPSIDLFIGNVDNQKTTKPKEMSIPKNEGWATFDSPQPVALPVTDVVTSSGMPRDENSSVNFDRISQFGSNMLWPAYQSSSVDQPSSSIPSPWHEDCSGFSAQADIPSTLSWNAFDGSNKGIPLEGVKQFSEPPLAAASHPSETDQNLGFRVPQDSSEDGIQRATSLDASSGFSFPANMFTPPSFAPSMVPEETWPHANKYKSSNPFDLPCDSELEPNNTFMEMSSLQAALPDLQPPLSGTSLPYFPEDPVVSYTPAPSGKQGGQGYLTGQAPTSQLQNVGAQGPVASVGGNPFA